MELFSGFLIGLVGSFHCAGMCGPIALSLPAGTFSKWSFLYGRILYNSGRVITYTALGALFGLLGDRLNLFGLQKGISISIGVIILLSVFAGVFIKKVNALSFFQVRIVSAAKKYMKINFSRRSYFSYLITGILNGILPCGFVYIGLSGALAIGDFTQSAFYMMLFGLGTFPLMFGISVFGNFIGLNIRNRINRLIPVFAVILAVLFILRGLDLGIPYLSPAHKENFKSNNTEVQCN
ncbi:MAG: sulfite exporter TauE/SafE family protein [Bacteroidetes bacterium]|nr:sulfite exporter TauE/SafE family protein [Bacteroidota bacterium]